MADIQEKILDKYGIDISQENILKLYKIDDAGISSQELETKIQDTRKRWNTSINGANEKNAERDRLRLEKADKYEAILNDEKLRKEIAKYYIKPAGGSSGPSNSSGGGSTEFAKEYFELIGTTKKIRKPDVDFFFQYFQSERKNKKAIIEMLSKDMKVPGLGKENSKIDENDSDDKEGKKKNDSSSLIVNLFQEVTILKIRRALEKFEEAAQSNELKQRYPKLSDGLYEYLEIGNVEDAKQFTEMMSEKGREVYAVRQERGTDYVPLVDLFNILQGIGEYRDVVDNFQEFKLLLKYPALTPYMYSFVEMKQSTLKGITKIASDEYSFRDDTDFILNYYKPVHDNFGISDTGISMILRKAEKKAKQNKVLNEIDEKLGRNKKKSGIPIGAEIIHFLLYWPIFAVYFVFETAKFVLTKLRLLRFPTMAVLFLLSNLLYPKTFGFDNIRVLKKLFYKAEWLSYLQDIFGDIGSNGFGIFVLSLAFIATMLIVYCMPPYFVSEFIVDFADDFNKRFDWYGLERTFRYMISTLKERTKEQYTAQKKSFLAKKVPKIIVNFLCLSVLMLVLHYIPIGVRILSEYTGYGQKEAVAEAVHEEDKEDEITEKTSEENSIPIGNEMVITASSANIRSGPGTDYQIVSTATDGELFTSTGREEAASNGRIWYEIYLDDDMTQTGWASEKVIEYYQK